MLGCRFIFWLHFLHFYQAFAAAILAAKWTLPYNCVRTGISVVTSFNVSPHLLLGFSDFLQVYQTHCHAKHVWPQLLRYASAFQIET